MTTACEAIDLIDTGRVIELSLDHDLGDDDAAGKGIHVIAITPPSDTTSRALIYGRGLQS